MITACWVELVHCRRDQYPFYRPNMDMDELLVGGRPTHTQQGTGYVEVARGRGPAAKANLQKTRSGVQAPDRLRSIQYR